MQKIMETVAQFKPDAEPDQLIRKQHGYVGKPVNRVDGRLKVQGAAKYSAEFKFENLAYAALHYSTITKGKIISIDTSSASNSAGVIAVITHENAPKMNDPAVAKSDGSSGGAMASDLPILRDAQIHWNGQPVAVIVAETQNQAEYAASLIKVEYEMNEQAKVSMDEQPNVSFNNLRPEAEAPSDIFGEPAELEKGDAEKALENAVYSIDRIYRTPRYNHNAIEPHATTAVWNEDGDELTAFDSTQSVTAFKNTLAKMFGLAEDKVRVVSPFVGGAFGGKVSMWWNSALCAAAAKVVKRPVTLALSREGVYRIIGGRSLTEQRVALGVNDENKLVALIHTGISATTRHIPFAEQITFPVRHLYDSENYFIGQKIVYLDTVSNTYLRAPGDSVGSFALESAIDELAYELKIDPVELRRLNEPERDPTNDKEFSMRNMIEAYRRGAEKFGWKHSEPRSQKDGKWLVGQGVASAFYPHYRIPSTCRLRISGDGGVLIQTAAHEMGMGTATVQIQHAADRLGLPVDKISFEYGDSSLPEAPIAGGSYQTVSVAASVAAAVEKVHQELLALAGDDYDSPLANLKYEQIEARGGGLFSKEDASQGETYSSILQRTGQPYIEVEATSGIPFEMMKYSMGSYGAQLCEVRVNEESGEVRVSRFLGSFDCGKILNPKTATSQFRGGIIMGIGMALTEETLFDERTGRIMNPSLAEYHVPVNLDVPHIEVIYNDIPDEHSPLGAHGVGEIGITGVAAAVSNAVFNATGKRIRDLPITLDKLM
jgi:xanthine dehydrogenase YagR molybdenum-binding subunit